MRCRLRTARNRRNSARLTRGGPDAQQTCAGGSCVPQCATRSVVVQAPRALRLLRGARAGTLARLLLLLLLCAQQQAARAASRSLQQQGACWAPARLG
jgi:hypothetical protein